MKKCDACGQEVAGGVGIGGTLLCRTCAPDVRDEIVAAHAAGRPVNAMGIARRMYRERHDTCQLLVRDFPADLHSELRVEAATNGTTIRALVIRAVEQFLIQLIQK